MPYSQPDSTSIKELFSQIAARYQLTNHLLCGGLDIWWRHVTAVEVAKKNPALILDIATGSGDLAVAILKKIPTAHITGVDFCEEMLAEAAKKKIPALTLVTADGLALPFPDESYDAVTIAFGLRNMESWEKGLREMNRVLRPGAPLFILDFSLPTAPLLKPLYRFYLHHLLPHFAGLITGRKEAYSYMAESIEQFPSGAAMCSLLERCGFEQATFTPMTFGVVTLYVAMKTYTSTSFQRTLE
jgi:demethylmenaquinone methyltransferase/2-methoxy-6-polyprenyl-1,4-benzoquinol methylase